jgi:hypothetical protein
MSPKFSLTIQIGERRIWLPLPLIFPLVLVMEILALLPMAIYATRKKEALPAKLVSRFYLSRFMLAYVLHGRKFKMSVCDGDSKFQIGGRMRRKPQPSTVEH